MTNHHDTWQRAKADYEAGASFLDIRDRYGLQLVDVIRRCKSEEWQRTSPARSTANVDVPPPERPSPAPCASAAEGTTVWDEARDAFRVGSSIKTIIDTFRLDPGDLLERAMQEDWRADLGLMLADRFRYEHEPDELLKRLDRLTENTGSDTEAASAANMQAGAHRCDGCGAVVERPVYCGRACQQRAYRGRKRDRRDGAPA